MVDDYNTYQFSLKEHIKYLMQGIVMIAVLGNLFYQSIVGAICLCPIVYFYKRGRKYELIKKRKWNLNLEFRDGIIALSAALEAGYSAENAFEEACKDLRLIYGEDSLIIREFTYLLHQIRMNITIEKALNEFGERTGVEDILSFAEVFATAKRTGGDLMKVIKITGSMIGDKIEIKREIITLVSEKRLEANIMKVIPILMLLYLSISSPGFLDPLYHNLFGVTVMTIFLGAYLGAFLLINKIVAIEV